MKKSTTLRARTVARSVWLSVWLAFAGLNFGQTSSEPIYGPYPDVWETQFVKVKIHFVDGDVPWTPSADLSARAENILGYINDVFLPYRIYFVAVQDDCPLADSIDACSGEVIYVVEQYAPYRPPENLRCDYAIDIFDHGDEGEIAGQAFSSPSKYLRVQGSFNGISASQSPNLIQMLGFAMGLLPTSNYLGGVGTAYTDDGCTDGECPLPPSVILPYCYCCEDGVCDTEVAPLYLDISSDCSACLNFPETWPFFGSNTGSYRKYPYRYLLPASTDSPIRFLPDQTGHPTLNPYSSPMQVPS